MTDYDYRRLPTRCVIIKLTSDKLIFLITNCVTYFLFFFILIFIERDKYIDISISISRERDQDQERYF